MPIEVFQIENLFWEPGSYRQPNALPSRFKDKKIFRNIPQLYDMHSGSITLIGDHWNWCQYEGIYYILKRSTPLDIRRKRYLYHMVRDPWANTVLSGRVVVKGDISIWNQDKELKKHLNRTFPIIEKPASVARISFKTVTNKWTNKLSYLKDDENSTIKLIDQNLLCPVLVEKHLSWLQEKAKQSSIFKEISEALFPARKDIYILGTLLPSYLKHNWKETVKDLCNKALKELLDDPERIIAKVSPSQASTNKLAGHYCVTYKREGIGVNDDSVELTEIDLSKVTDIKRISWSTLEAVNPDRILDEKTGILETESNNFDYYTSNKVYKLARKIYLPLGTVQTVTKNKYKIQFGNWRYTEIGPQIVKVKADEFSNEENSFFYWTDKIDFQLSWYFGSDSPHLWYEHLYTPAVVVGAGVGTFLTGGALLPVAATVSVTTATAWTAYHELNRGGSWEAIPSTLYGLANKLYDTEIWRKYFSLVDSLWKNGYLFTKNTTFPYFPRNLKETNEYSIWNKFKKKTPSYGMLMFQVERKWDEWERCVYLGNKKKEELQVYCGIRRGEFKKRFKDKTNEWWSNISGPLKKLCGEETISKFFLDYYQLNFLNFVPSRGEKPYETTQHKCDYDDEYEIKPYLYGERNCEITRFLNSQEFKRPSGEKVENPWRPEIYGNFWYPKEKDRQNFLLTAPLKLKQPLEKGDFLISDLEYEWRSYNTNWWKPNVSQWKRNVLTEDWATYTMNLFEDFLANTEKSGLDFLKDNDPVFDDIEKKIYLCTDLDGNVGFRTAYKFTEQHQLCTDDDQMVTSVDGSTKRQTTYWHFKGSNIPILGEQDRLATKKLIGAFYKQLGYSVVIDDAAVYWDFLKPEEVTSDPEGHLFDLVGSDWYVFIRKEKVHFIIKKPKNIIIQPLVQKSEAFDKPEKVTEEGKTKSDFQILNELTLTQKINQICTFHHKTYSFPMKSKFLFTYEKEPIEPSIVIDGVDTEDNLKLLDYYVLTLKNAYDIVDEPISLPVKTTMIQNMGDKMMYDRIRREQMYADEDHFLRKQQLGLGQRVVEAEARRAQWDLDMKAYNKKWSIALDSIGMIGSLWRAGSAPLAAGIKAMTARAGASHDYEVDAIFNTPNFPNHGIPTPPRQWSPGDSALPMVLGMGATYRDTFSVTVKDPDYSGLNLSKAFKTSRKIERGLGIGGKGGIMGHIGGLVEAGSYLNHVYPEMSKRVEEDKRFATQEIMFKLYENDYTHFRRRQDAALKIDGLVHTWTREYPSAVEIEEKWQTKKKVKDTYISVQYPSEEQAYYLEEYRREFGVACDIPNQVIALTSGMSENIICFRNIDDEGIVGVNNEFDREWLREKLLAGVKIVDAEQVALPYDYFDHNLIAPSVIKDDESLLKVVDELRKELDSCKKQGTITNKYWIKNFDIALKKIKEDADDPDKLKEDIEAVKKEIAAAEQHPENYDKEVVALYKRLLEALETEHEQVLKIIKDRKDLEAAVKRADDAENERDDLREQITKAHQRQRELLDAKEKLEKECNSAKAAGDTAIAQCEAEKDRYSSYLTHLQELNDGWATLAKKLGIPVREIPLRPDGPKTELDDIKKMQTEIAAGIDAKDTKNSELDSEITKLKNDLAKKQAELSRCRANTFDSTVSISKSMRGWTYCDFLRTFQQMNWNYEAMYKAITRSPTYGFSNETFFVIKAPKLQAIHQTIDECEDLLDNNNYFLPQDNKALREYLLTEEGADQIRGMKRYFVKEFSLQWLTNASQNERNTLGNQTGYEMSKFYKEKISLTIYDNHIFNNINPADDWSIVQKLKDSLGIGPYKKTMWDSGDARNLFAFKYSFWWASRWFLMRNDPKAWNWPKDWNTQIWYAHGFYDVQRHDTPAIFLWSTITHITGLHEGYVYRNVYTKQLPSELFSWRPNNFSHSWKYEGFSNRRFFPGYVLWFVDKMIDWKRFEGLVVSSHDWKRMCETVAPCNLHWAKRWIANFSRSKEYWEKYDMYGFKVMYQVLCNSKSWADAQEIVEQELAAAANQG